ncbi:hypothetical protein KIPB_002208 [Kipferlia bialata]|uniref:Uncharacterized protein n=1 Tax=Kipferlia bialata TaxID=797122 RepID=A0A9K3CTB9_9EUKA|nr:hypothetical protein KIPB_002208 [Kipferlia bialata]|eukprot:g2208.t1
MAKRPYGYSEARADHRSAVEVDSVTFTSLDLPHLNERGLLRSNIVHLMDSDTCLAAARTFTHDCYLQFALPQDNVSDVSIDRSEYQLSTKSVWEPSSAPLTECDCLVEVGGVVIGHQDVRETFDDVDGGYPMCVIRCYEAGVESRVSLSTTTSFIDGYGVHVTLPTSEPKRLYPLHFPSACALRDHTVWFNDKCNTYLFDAELYTITIDKRKSPAYNAFTAVDGVVHVFHSGDRTHHSYTPKHGWTEHRLLPQGLGDFSMAQTAGRLIVLFGQKGIHAYDTISGDWIHLSKDTTFNDNTGCTSIGDRRCLSRLVTRRDTVNQTTDVVATLLTLNEALVYPDEQRVWAQLHEWDKALPLLSTPLGSGMVSESPVSSSLSSSSSFSPPYTPPSPS